LLLEFATQTPHLNTLADKLWSFAFGKTPEVNPQSGFTTETPDKPEFFAEQKMGPNEVLKKPLTSVNSFWVEALYTAS
jgi:hypothetical protein